MKRTRLIVLAAVLVMVAGASITKLLSSVVADDAENEARARAEVRGAGAVSCGSDVVIEVFLDELAARKSRSGADVGLGAYNVELNYPTAALRPAREGAAVVVTPDGAPTVDGATGRQWIPGPPFGDAYGGSLTFGAFSYLGADNQSKQIDDIEVTDDIEQRGAAGVVVRTAAPLHLGSFRLATGQAGTHSAEVELTIVDSSIDALEYEINTITVPIEVTNGPCAVFERLEPPPTPRVGSPGAFTGEDFANIPTPDRYPDDIPAGDIAASLGDACRWNNPYITKLHGTSLCLPPGWSITEDPSPAYVDGTIATETAKGNPYELRFYATIERKDAAGGVLARVGITVRGSEPFSITGCDAPVEVAELGTLCVHERRPGGEIMAIYWRLIGVTTEDGEWVTVEIFDVGDLAAKTAVQQEALELVKSMKRSQ